MAGNFCDTCGHDQVVGVAASAHGPASFAFCELCVGMQAEPIGMASYVVEDVYGGRQNLEGKVFVTFKDGHYWDYIGEKVYPIKFLDGRSTEDPKEARKWLDKLREESNEPTKP